MPGLVSAAAAAVVPAEEVLTDVAGVAEFVDAVTSALDGAADAVASDVPGGAGAAGRTAAGAGALAGFGMLDETGGAAFGTSSRATGTGLALFREDCNPTRSTRRLKPRTTKRTTLITRGPDNLERPERRGRPGP